jgi:CheY-like chemotaxis protein
VEALRPTAQEKDLELTLALPEAELLVLGDPDRLEQVWWNLLSNAIKFTPHGGGVTVAATEADGHLEVRVRDTGEGIPPEMLPHVFERFRQGDSTSTRRHGGLGLGLSLVRHFVEAHGGTVRAASEGRDRGAELLVRLPRLGPRAVLPLVGRPEAGPDRARRPLSGLRVLVVDDDTDIRAMMRAVLARRGAAVVEAGSVQEALAAIEAEVPDVVLSDLQMPGEDGYGLLARLKERERRGARPIPTAAVTAHAGAEHRAQALAAGFDSQVSKPIDAESLARLVIELAGDARSAGA